MVMKTLVFQLHAPLSSWGDVAVGEYRPSADYPSQSAIQGLMGAALGIRREDAVAQEALANGYAMAVGVISAGRLLRDYHTAQVPGRVDMKGRPHASRQDELAIAKSSLNTILSTRDYRQEASALVAIRAGEGAKFSLEQIADALRTPHFVLYVGRKSCPLSAPLAPMLTDAPTIVQAFDEYGDHLGNLWKNVSASSFNAPLISVQKIVWGDEWGMDDMQTIGIGRDLSTKRKDKVLNRKRWQFGDRLEHIGLLVKE